MTTAFCYFRSLGTGIGSYVEDGMLKSWDDTQITLWNLFTGELERWAWIPQTAVRISFCNHRLYVAENPGWVHAVSTY